MDYIKILDDYKSWAKNLLILQYKQSPKNKALIETLVDLIFANNLILQIRDLCLNVEKSVGTQLDVVGKWVGIDRYYNAFDLWEQPFLALVNYSQVANSDYLQWQGGFSSYSTFNNNDGGFLTYAQWKETRLAVNEMGDEYFRKLIKLKIIKNSIAFTNKNIDEAIWKWSNGEVYTTWGVMEVTYHYPASWSNIIDLAVYKNVLLAPTGCKIITEAIT